MFKKSLWAASTGNSAHAYRSIEAYDVNEDIVNPVTNEVVGEADSEIADLAVESLSISQEMDEIQRTTNVAEAGEVIADVATQVASRDATPEEAALVQAGAAQTAIAAGATASDVAEVADQVASESNGKFTVSNEGFVETIKNLWKKLQEWVMGLVQKIKNAWNRFWNSTEALKKKAAALKKALDEKSDVKTEEKLTKWSGYFRNLTTDGKFDPAASLAKFKNLGKEISGEFGKVTERTANVSKAVSTIATKDGAGIDETVENEVSKIISGTTSLSDYLGNGYVGKKVVLPFGNKGYVVGFDGGDNTTAASKINSYTARMIDVSKSFDPKPKELSVNFFSKSQIEDLVDAVDGCAKSLEDWYNKGSKDADKKIDEVRKEIDKHVSDAKDDDDANKKEALRAVQRFYTVPTQDLRLSMELCTYAIRTANDMLSLGKLMANNLKKAESK